MDKFHSDEDQIRNVITNWVHAIREKNMQGILDRHTEDILMFDVPAPLQSKGMEEYKKTWRLFFQYSQGGEGSFELEELKITAGKHVAFCTALIRLATGRKPECRLTIGLQKIERKWIIVHEHHSAPHQIK